MIEAGGSLHSLKSDKLYKDDQELFSLFNTGLSQEPAKVFHKKALSRYPLNSSSLTNTINRMTGQRARGCLRRNTADQKVYLPGMELSIFVGLDDTINIEQLKKAVGQIGTLGFGRDASTGLGKISVVSSEEVDLSALGSPEPNACYNYRAAVPEKDVFSRLYFSPFTRFGRHGDVLARAKNPFKNPVIMADEGAVLISDNRMFLSCPI
jgi:CRISPR-associated protein Csm4